MSTDRAKLAEVSKKKFAQIIAKGQESAVTTLTKLAEERPTDRVVNTRGFQFKPTDTGIVLDLEGEEFMVHPHALNQSTQRTGILGQRTVRNLLDTKKPWAHEVVADMFNKTYANINESRFLVRSVGNEVRGVLSDRYRRMDSGPIFEQFIKASQQFGAVPTNSKFMDTKFTLTMSLPTVFEPIKDEIMMFGATIANSDYGDGALSVKFALLRIWCTNLCMREECMRKVHLGRRLGDNIQYSEKTYQLDTDTMTSAVNDLVRHNFLPEKVEQNMEVIREAATAENDIAKVFATLQRGNKITKAEKKEIVELYNSPEVELLPPGNNLWRASNAISLFAQKQGDAREFELQSIAGDLL